MERIRFYAYKRIKLNQFNHIMLSWIVEQGARRRTFAVHQWQSGEFVTLETINLRKKSQIKWTNLHASFIRRWSDKIAYLAMHSIVIQGVINGDLSKLLWSTYALARVHATIFHQNHLSLNCGLCSCHINIYCHSKILLCRTVPMHSKKYWNTCQWP